MNCQNSSNIFGYSDFLSKWQLFMQRYYDSYLDMWMLHVKQKILLPAGRQSISSDTLDLLRATAASHYTHVLNPAVDNERDGDGVCSLAELFTLSGYSSVDILRISHFFYRFWEEKIDLLLADVDHYDFYKAVSSFLEMCFYEDQVAMFRTMESIKDRYFQQAILKNKKPMTWLEWRQDELDHLASLSGIRMAFVMRLNEESELMFELRAGYLSTESIEEPNREALPNVKNSMITGQAMVAQALRDYQIVSTPDFQTRPGSRIWSEKAKRWGLVSALAIPVRLNSNADRLVIVLFGMYENQFESPWIKEFAEVVQTKWEEKWSLYQNVTSKFVIEPVQADYYRNLLFTDGLVMVGQPIVSCQTGRVEKVELLARLQLPDGQLIMPNRFLPLLTNEEMNKLFQMTLDRAMTTIKAWEKESLSVNVTVNLAPITLAHPNCSLWIEELLRYHRISAQQLTLELLETQSIQEDVMELLFLKIKNLGLKVAIDDLGSGYSSILRLSRLPFDVIKIDQKLLRDIREHPISTMGLLYGLIQLGHSLGKEVVVEGVEYLGVLEAMKVLNATMCQGYYLARPMSLTEITGYIRNREIEPWDTEIHTFTGALAIVWLLYSQKTHITVTAFEDCRIAKFFERIGWYHEEAMGWLQALHHGGESFQENVENGLSFLLPHAVNELKG